MNKTAIKTVALVAVGVIVAGFAMNQFQSLGPVADARRGYTG